MTKASKKDRRMKARKGKSERLTEKDLMGMNMPVYRRGKGGAWRNVR